MSAGGAGPRARRQLAELGGPEPRGWPTGSSACRWTCPGSARPSRWPPRTTPSRRTPGGGRDDRGAVPGQPVHLFGNSMGGAVALQVAARRADLVRTLCLDLPALPDLRPHLTNIHVPVIRLPRVGNVLPSTSTSASRRTSRSRRRSTSATPTVAAAPAAPSRGRGEKLSGGTRCRRFPRRVRRLDAGLLATYVDRGPTAVSAGPLGRGANAAGVRRRQLVGPSAAHQAAKGVLGRACDGHPVSRHVAIDRHPGTVDRLRAESGWVGQGVRYGSVPHLDKANVTPFAVRGPTTRPPASSARLYCAWHGSRNRKAGSRRIGAEPRTCHSDHGLQHIEPADAGGPQSTCCNS